MLKSLQFCQQAMILQVDMLFRALNSSGQHARSTHQNLGLASHTLARILLDIFQLN